MEVAEEPSDLQSSHLPKRNSQIETDSLHPHSGIEDVRQRTRPKTSTNKEEAKQYNLEGQEGEDFGMLFKFNKLLFIHLYIIYSKFSKV